MFAQDHEAVAKHVQELAASSEDGPEWSRKLLAYEERDRQTRGSRFVVSAMDLFWMGLRAIKSNPDLAAEFEAEAEAAERLKG